MNQDFSVITAEQPEDRRDISASSDHHILDFVCDDLAEQPKKEKLSDHHISDFVCDNLAEQPKKENLRRSKRKCVKKDLKVRFNFKKRTFV